MAKKLLGLVILTFATCPMFAESGNIEQIVRDFVRVQIEYSHPGNAADDHGGNFTTINQDQMAIIITTVNQTMLEAKVYAPVIILDDGIKENDQLICKITLDKKATSWQVNSVASYCYCRNNPGICYLN